MKYSENDIQMIEKYEQKRNIRYAKTGGKLYKYLFVIGFISWVYMIIMSIFYLLGKLLLISESMDKSDSVFITILTVTAILVTSPLIYAFISKFATLILNILCVPVLAAAYIKILLVGGTSQSGVSELETGIFGVKKIFYIPHGIPMFIVFLICVLLLVIIAREYFIKKKEYKTITENSYTPQIITKDE